MDDANINKDVSDIVYYVSKSRPKQSRALSTDESDIIKKYLNNPIEYGVWNIKLNFTFLGSIFEFINQKLDEFNKSEDRQTLFIGESEREITKEKIDEISKNIKDINKCFDYSFLIFNYLNVLDNPQDFNIKDVINSEDIEEISIIIKIIGADNLKSRFQSAYDIFKTKISYDGFEPMIKETEIFKLSSGNVVLHLEKMGMRRKIAVLYSLSDEPLEILKEFFKDLGLIKNIKIEKIYSPKEALFTPYVTYLNSVYRQMPIETIFRRRLMNAINEHIEENYNHVISTMGLMVEGILKNIYETLFHEELENNLTMGEINNKIKRNVTEIVTPKTQKGMESKDLFEELNPIIARFATDQNTNVQKELLEIFRKKMHNDVEYFRYLEDKIKQVQNQHTEISIFNRKINSNYNEVHGLRNAVSHNSEIPIGRLEATRSIYCSLTLLNWWNKEKQEIDWKNSKEEIIKKIVERNQKK